MDNQLRIMQFKLLHRILPVNTWLYKCGLTNTNTCSFCHIHIETIQHLMWECNLSKNIWLALCQHMNIPFFTMKETLLGKQTGSAIEHIKLITKNYIFRTKLDNNLPNFQFLKQIIKSKVKIERNCSSRQQFIKKWGTLHTLF